jgi:hypothetical protein
VASILFFIWRRLKKAARAPITVAIEAKLMPPTAPHEREPTVQEPDCGALELDVEVDFGPLGWVVNASRRKRNQLCEK